MKDDQKKTGEDELRPHVYDGIQEYDNKLPNWWLMTFYIAIIITVVYWFTYYNAQMVESDAERVDTEMARIEEARLAAIGDLNNDTLWQMSRNSGFVEAGRAVYMEKCLTCHGAELQGGIGQNLVDAHWLYGNEPMAVYTIVSGGSPNKASGMQSWIGELGPKRVSQVVAFVLSHHDPEELAAASVEKPGQLDY